MENTPSFVPIRLCAVLGACALASVAHAQITRATPDAGQTLQQLQPPVVVPRESQPVLIDVPAASSAGVQPGGAVVLLQSVGFTGHSVMSEAALRTVLGDVLGKSYDLAGLRGLSDRVSEHYRANGYPFALAVLPPQDLQAGQLRIDIIEGRYGQVQAQSDAARLAAIAQLFLRNLKPGAVIEITALERASLILNELPGIETSLVMRPGAEIGTGDLLVQVSRAQRFTGDLGLDNAGSRYTGQIRARANLNINSPFTLGDQIKINTLISDEQLWLGSLGYSLPLGASGLRGNVGYAVTRYVLVKEFANSQASGSAKVASASLSYPLVRSQKANLTLSGTYQAKDLRDIKMNIRESRSSQSMPIALQFDRRDSLGGGGMTYGIMTWAPGQLQLDASLTAADVNNTRGSFNKFNLDVVRLQSLPAGFSLMGRISLQSASKNLDSSEKTSLGGSGGVRAYPVGEANGDESVLAQLELRYGAGMYSPYVFADGGSSKTNAKPVADETNNKRSLSGVGLGVRYQRNAWSADAALAWRGIGGIPKAEPFERDPRAWLSVSYRF